jgi:cyclic pyranopterin phosphate synthase
LPKGDAEHPAGFSHLDRQGRATMVDVSPKAVTRRLAVARGRVTMSAEALDRLREGRVAKGNVFETARLAGIMAVKETSRLIPLCHPLPVDHVQVDLELSDDPPGVLIEARVSAEARTGVEMEALTAVGLAALTIYDMMKALDKTMVISDVRLVKKSGGRSGDFVRPGEEGSS